MSQHSSRSQRSPRSKSVSGHDIINDEVEANEPLEGGSRSPTSNNPPGSSRPPTAPPSRIPSRACKPGCSGLQAGFQGPPVAASSGVMATTSREHGPSSALRSNNGFQGSYQRYQQQRTCPHSENRRTSPTPMVEHQAHTGHGGRAPSPRFESSQTHLKSPPLTLKKSSSPTGEHSHHHHHLRESSEDLLKLDERAKSAITHLSQIKETPSHFQCNIGKGLDFLKSGFQKPREVLKPPKKFPEIPCLRENDLLNLIRCETEDVESANYLIAEQKKTYKKPCPKQQKAQMTVKALVQAHVSQICGKEYSPLEHPDPEDISPEVAAAMMFSQERGIKMDEYPAKLITSLFPDVKINFPLKDEESISIVDSKDQEEMIEKSASVPSEGVSDSVYARTMKDKGESAGPQKSFDVDFAIGQSKREYVVVAQKPQRINKIQYRGGNAPSWFPGYFSAFPKDEGIKVEPSPSGLLYKAWAQSNPKNLPATDVIVLD